MRIIFTQKEIRIGAKHALALAALLALGVSGTALAQDASSTGSMRPPRPMNQPRREGIEARIEMRAEASTTRQDMRDERRETASTTRAGILGSIKAQVEAFRENRTEKTSEIKAKRDALILEWKEKKDDRREKLAADAKVRIENRLTNVYERLTKHIESVTKADAKISLRINELTASGTSTVELQGLYATAQTALSKAKVDIEATKTIATEQLSASSTSKEALKGMVKTAEASIKAAAESYKAVLKALKPYAPKRNATTTVSASVSAN